MNSAKSKSIRGQFITSIVLIAVLIAVPSIVLMILGANGLLEKSLQIVIPVIVVYLAIVLIASIFYVLRSSKKMFRNLSKIEIGLDQLEKGSLNVHIEDLPNDEIGRAANSLNAFSAELKKSIQALRASLDALAKGDLTFRSNYVWKGDWEEISTALTHIIKSLNLIFMNAKNSAEQTASGSQQVASGSQALAQGATEQASSIEQLSATVTEISEHVKDNASNAAEASRVSSVAEDKLKEANHEMDAMVEAMSEISETSKQIGNIIKTIDNIAFQTNILALNAAVEAARAGSAGKGFAVVADEVRNLASKSAEAAKNTTDLIENSVKAVSNGSEIADSTEKTLKEVLDASTHANELIGQISKASNQQATSIGQINQGVQQISAVVQTNSATAEESAAASEELAAQSKALMHSLENLKLNAIDKGTSPTFKQIKVPAAQKKAAPKKMESAKAAAEPVAANDKYV
ncbi:MAG: methyl-accepting chemotaxis protein [Oscillospiraceae bacterium]|jgi:methyl-accepting chemotaxis protein|nr:methyl-accepting chemotaxis protein [Oscillospiraceae bacterium]